MLLEKGGYLWDGGIDGYYSIRNRLLSIRGYRWVRTVPCSLASVFAASAGGLTELDHSRYNGGLFCLRRDYAENFLAGNFRERRPVLFVRLGLYCGVATTSGCES